MQLQKVVIAPALSSTAASSADCRDSTPSHLPASILPGKDPSWAFPQGDFSFSGFHAIHKKWLISTISSLMLSVLTLPTTENLPLQVEL